MQAEKSPSARSLITVEETEKNVNSEYGISA